MAVADWESWMKQNPLGVGRTLLSFEHEHCLCLWEVPSSMDF
jgi:hypothetical protein